MEGTTKEEDRVRYKVDVLLREYDTLREEVIARTNNRFAISGLLGAIMVFVGGKSELDIVWRWTVVLVALVVLTIFWWSIGDVMHQIGAHLIGIEGRVNALLGEQLLEWERATGNRRATRWLYPKFTTRKLVL